jgi:hypothetical protein
MNYDKIDEAIDEAVVKHYPNDFHQWVILLKNPANKAIFALTNNVGALDQWPSRREAEIFARNNYECNQFPYRVVPIPLENER